ALTYPERHSADLPPLDLTALATLHFEEPDRERFPCIDLAYRALREGGTLPTALNAANEEAVRAFIEERICLTDIPRVIESVMDQHFTKPASDLETVIEADRTARIFANVEIEKMTKTSAVLAGRLV
ncbi:MAG: 1-deoxy-D-xylulose-5-phosphate reductoisomerase, partial [Acidobacteriota bacterium]